MICCLINCDGILTWVCCHLDLLQKFMLSFRFIAKIAANSFVGEGSGLVVEHQTLNREVLGLIPMLGSVLCP